MAEELERGIASCEASENEFQNTMTNNQVALAPPAPPPSHLISPPDTVVSNQVAPRSLPRPTLTSRRGGRAGRCRSTKRSWR
jgi:hypothetical protein